MIYRGKVTAVTSTSATVLVTDLDPVQSFGPLSCVGAVPAVGDIVLVVEVGDNGSSLPDLVVVNPTSGSDLSGKVSKTGDTMSGALAMGSNKITGLADGTASGDAVNKSQLDAKVAGPSSSTDNAIARYDGTTGKVVQNSAVTVGDGGTISATGNIDTTGNYLYLHPNGDAFVSADATGSSGNYSYWLGRTRWGQADKNEVHCGVAYDGAWFVSQKIINGATVSADNVLYIYPTNGRVQISFPGQNGGLQFGTGSGPRIMSGTGAPTSVTAPRGSIWISTDGARGSTLYVKESGNNDTSGWVPQSRIYAESVTVTGSGWSGTPIAKDISVTFPSGRFTRAPVVTATFAANTNNNHVSVEVKSSSTTGATIRIISGDSFWSSNTSYVNVIAVEAAT